MSADIASAPGLLAQGRVAFPDPVLIFMLKAIGVIDLVALPVIATV
jgi:hypothetical protein